MYTGMKATRDLNPDSVPGLWYSFPNNLELADSGQIHLTFDHMVQLSLRNPSYFRLVHAHFSSYVCVYSNCR